MEKKKSVSNMINSSDKKSTSKFGTTSKESINKMNLNSIVINSNTTNSKRNSVNYTNNNILQMTPDSNRNISNLKNSGEISVNLFNSNRINENKSTDSSYNNLNLKKTKSHNIKSEKSENESRINNNKPFSRINSNNNKPSNKLNLITDSETKSVNRKTIKILPEIHENENENENHDKLKQTFPSSLLMNSNDTMSNTSQIKVIARFRPLNITEQNLAAKDMGTICCKFNNKESVIITNNFNNETSFTLDWMFDPNTNQRDLYDQVVKSSISDVLKGYNGTIFTYGQSGSGKTFSMYGPDLYDDQFKGIIPRAIDDIFQYINDDVNKEIKFELKFSMLEIYKENLNDLLNPTTKSSDLKIKEHPKKGIYVTNLTEEYISDQDEFLLLIEKAEEMRAVASHDLNKVSSRSHLLLQLEIIQKMPDDTEHRGMLNLIDLAGSEKITKTNATGDTLEEAKKINLSLSTLGNVISALTSGKGEFVPYRDSKLTRILQDSLAGNYKTTLVVTCSPHIYNCEETISTLKFAARAKKIKNKVKLNIKKSVEQLELIIENLNKQLLLSSDEINRLKRIINIGNNFSESSVYSNTLIDEPSQCVSPTNKCQVNSNVMLSSVIKRKDEEINNLNERIDSLQEENKCLQDKINKISKETGYIYFYQILEKLENFTKTSIEDIKNLYVETEKIKLNELITENKKLRENYNTLETKYLQDFQNIQTQIFSDLEENTFLDEQEYLKKYHIDFSSFFKKMENIDKNVNHKNSVTYSYKKIYENSNLYINCILKEFLNKRDLFVDKFSENSNILHYTNNEIKVIKKNSCDQNIKSSFIKINLLMIYYEKILFDLMNRMLVDIKLLEREQTNRIMLEKKSDNFNKSLKMYLEILEDLKEMKVMKERKEMEIKMKEENSPRKYSHFDKNSNIEDRHIIDSSRKCSHIPIEENCSVYEKEEYSTNKLPDNFDINEKKRNRLQNNLSYLNKMNYLRQETPKAFYEISNSNIIENYSMCKQQISSNNNIKRPVIRQTTFGSLRNSSNFNHAVRRLMSSKAGQEKPEHDITFNNENSVSGPKVFEINEASSDSSNDKIAENKNNEKTDKAYKREKGNKFLLKSKATKSCVSKINNSIFSNIGFNNIIEIIAELNNLKKELNAYKVTVNNLSDELHYVKSNNLEINTIISEFQESQKKILECEIDNFRLSVNIYKCLYDDEIRAKRTKIEELSKVVDEVYLNSSYPSSSVGPFNPSRSDGDSLGGHKNSLSNITYMKSDAMHTASRSSLISEYLENKKEKTLLKNTDDHLKNMIRHLSEIVLEEGGSATKKLDYILIKIEKKFDQINVVYDSGLNGYIPSKSPLIKNFLLSLVGDSYSDIESPENID